MNEVGTIVRIEIPQALTATSCAVDFPQQNARITYLQYEAMLPSCSVEQHRTRSRQQVQPCMRTQHKPFLSKGLFQDLWPQTIKGTHRQQKAKQPSVFQEVPSVVQIAFAEQQEVQRHEVIVRCRRAPPRSGLLSARHEENSS